MKTLEQHNREIRESREAFKKLPQFRTGLACGCGGEFIEEPFRNASIPPTTWVTCKKCGKRALKEQP